MAEKRSDETTLKESPLLLAKGFCMGSADIVPGVSGGTMALILGIYERLINAIKSVDLIAIKSLFQLRLNDVFVRVHCQFIITLLTGMLLAIAFFTRVVRLQDLMFVQPEPVYGLFFGLILGSVWYVSRDFGKLTFVHLMWILIGALVGLRVVTFVPVDSPETALFVFFSGALAITAMILPGISGSFILLILRKYDYILLQLSKLGGDETLDAIIVLIPFALGMVAGIMLFSRVLSWLLSRYKVRTLCVLVGFMIGSLYVIWPFQDRVYSESVRVEMTSISDERIAELKDLPASQFKPEFRRLGETSPDGDKIAIETVKLKLVSTTPFIPSVKNADDDSRLQNGRNSVYLGFVMMFVGLVLVVVLSLAAKRKKSEI